MKNLKYSEQFIDGIIDGVKELSFGFGVKFIYLRNAS